MTDLLTPVMIGPYLLRNRIVLPPLTRNRADGQHVPTPRMTLYYRQRASAGLMVAEGTAISPRAVAYPRVPGIWSEDQVRAWSEVTNAVRHAGGTFFMQLWHVGRVSHRLNQPDGGTPVSSSALPVPDEQLVTYDGMKPFEPPRALARDEIADVVREYAAAARNAMRAGFDGVEIHGANGYLVDQFLNDNINDRTDDYGGPVENRVRFLAEVLDAVCGVWGSDRVGLRLSPSGTFMGAGDSDRKTTYTAAVRVAAERDLGYLHLVEPTIAGSMSVEAAADAIPTSYFRSIYPGTLIVSGDHTPQTGHEAIRSGAADLVGFGRAFISNPDLPWRIASGAELAPSNRATYYTDGDEGYHDYPSLEEQAFADALQMAEMEGAVDVARAGRALRESQAEWLIASGEWYASQRLIAAQGQQG